jgi:hypothetical protein
MGASPLPVRMPLHLDGTSVLFKKQHWGEEYFCFYHEEGREYVTEYGFTFLFNWRKGFKSRISLLRSLRVDFNLHQTEKLQSPLT